MKEEPPVWREEYPLLVEWCVFGRALPSTENGLLASRDLFDVARAFLRGFDESEPIVWFALYLSICTFTLYLLA